MLIKAGTAFAIAALLTGTLPPLSPRWREVSVELHQAEPQAQVKAQVKSRVQQGLHHILSRVGKG